MARTLQAYCHLEKGSRDITKHLGLIRFPQHFTDCALSRCIFLASIVTKAIILCEPRICSSQTLS